jgi:hypothetical protein
LLAYNIGIRAILYSKVSKKDTKGQVNLPSAKRRFEKKIIQIYSVYERQNETKWEHVF